MEILAQRYNVPKPILEAMNQQIQNPNVLTPGSIAYIPRMDKMYCHKMYLEQEAIGTESGLPQQTMTQTGMPYQTYPGQQAMPTYSGTNYPAYPGQQTTPMF